MCHNQDQMIAKLEVQIEQLAATIRGREKDITLVKLCTTQEDTLLLKILQQASLKLVLI